MSDPLQHLHNLERALQTRKDELARAIARNDKRAAVIAQQRVHHIGYKIEQVKEFYND